MESVSPRERLYEVFSGTDVGVEAQIDEALRVGSDYFDLPIGFFTRVSDERQEIVRSVGDHDLIQPGESCPLKSAYCRRTVEAEGVLAVRNADDSVIDQRAIDVFDLGTYIGTKVTVNGEVYGTVCFAKEEVRDRQFSEAGELFLELLARLISTALERRRYERDIEAQNARLQQEKQRFEGIAENSFDILFRLGPGSTFTYVSSAVEPILGYEPADLVDEPFYEFVTEDAAATALPQYAEALNGEQVEGLELDFLDQSGEVVVLEVNATPISDDGEVVGVQGVGRDITDRKERERELRIKNRAFDEAEVGVVIVDPHEPGQPLIYVNRGFERITGYDESELLGRNCRMLQGEATDPDPVGELREAIQAEEPTTVELINYRRDGTPFWNRVQVNPVFDEEGRLRHYLGFQTDVTERRRTEKLIQLLNRVLRHNLRNDMNAVAGWAKAIQSADSEGVRDASERIERIASSLVDLGEHARELEQYIQRDREPTRLDPEELLREALEGPRQRYPGATFAVDIGSERAVCAGTELSGALTELLENAVKHNPSSAPTADVTVRDDGEWVEVVITDDGPGIGEMERRVVTSGSETALEHGSGLGLWLVNWTVTRYGGSFQISPRGDGDGTAAIVRVPAIAADQSVADVETKPTVLFR